MQTVALCQHHQGLELVGEATGSACVGVDLTREQGACTGL